MIRGRPPLSHDPEVLIISQSCLSAALWVSSSAFWRSSERSNGRSNNHNTGCARKAKHPGHVMQTRLGARFRGIMNGYQDFPFQRVPGPCVMWKHVFTSGNVRVLYSRSGWKDSFIAMGSIFNIPSPQSIFIFFLYFHRRRTGHFIEFLLKALWHCYPISVWITQILSWNVCIKPRPSIFQLIQKNT